jgi:hypothetical protein
MDPQNRGEIAQGREGSDDPSKDRGGEREASAQTNVLGPRTRKDLA